MQAVTTCRLGLGKALESTKYVLEPVEMELYHSYNMDGDETILESEGEKEDSESEAPSVLNQQGSSDELEPSSKMAKVEVKKPKKMSETQKRRELLCRLSSHKIDLLVD
ncbi:hypothetical protein EMCRGX_G029767 [Ephydatia muelleri]